MISDGDEDQLYDNGSDLDFLDTKMQCKNNYHKAGVKVLDQIIETFNASLKMVKKIINFSRLHQNLGDAEYL